MKGRTIRPGENRGPGVPVPTPVFYLVALLVGVGLDVSMPILLMPHIWGYAIGAVFIILSFLIMPPILKRFKEAGTPFKVREVVTALITDGPYRYSRNPGYISLTLLYVGMGFVINSVWVLVLLIPTRLLVDLWIVRREERNLEEIFGEQYLLYKSVVRRWL